MKLGTEVGLGPGHIVLHGDPVPSPKGAQPPQFSAHVCCGQTAGWIKMPLGREVGLGTGDRGPNSLSPKRGYSRPPLFGPCLLWSNGWMDQDITWYGGRPSPRPHSVRREPSSPPKGGTVAPLTFWSMSVVAKQLDGSRCHLVRR